MSWALTPDLGVFRVQAVISHLRLSVAAATCLSPISGSYKLLPGLASAVPKKFLEGEDTAGVALFETRQARGRTKGETTGQLCDSQSFFQRMARHFLLHCGG